ncbi:MAG: cardiolipin synthase [Anaeroplasma bactoclasticum]|nr:cardiolipin synthase [Anaeroplasma bactoclasticum]
MKKLLKIIFGRLTIVTILILSQVCLLIWGVFIAYRGYRFMPIITTIINIFLLIDLINRDMIADLKIPWIAIITIVPIAGPIIYMLFSRNLARKSSIRFYDSVLLETQQTISDLEVESTQLGDVAGQSNYIKNTSGCGLFQNTKTIYFDSGEHFFKEYVEDIKTAKSFIFMEYFILQRGIMLDTVLEILESKVKEGVEIRIIYDDIGTIGKLPSNFDKLLKKKGINCIKFNRFLPFVTAIHNNRDHRKITIIDGKIGYVGGINFADEYINAIERFGYWKDASVKLVGDATRQLTVMFLQNFDLQAKLKEPYQKYTQIDIEPVVAKGFVQPFCDGPSPVYPDLIGENVYLNLINQAKKTIMVSTPYLIVDSQMKNAMISAAKRNVRILIFTPHIPDKKSVFVLTRSNYVDLIKHGVEIYEYEPGFIHTKNILVDDELAVVGTINLDYRSLVHHYECGIWMYQTECIKDIKDDFDNILKHSIYIDPKHFKLNRREKILSMILKIFSPMM